MWLQNPNKAALSLCQVSLIYEAERLDASMSSLIADHTVE